MSMYVCVYGFVQFMFLCFCCCFFFFLIGITFSVWTTEVPESGHLVEEVYQEGSQMYLMYFHHADKMFLRLSFTHVSSLLALSHTDTCVVIRKPIKRGNKDN